MPQGAFADRCAEIIGDRGAIAVMDLKTGRLIAATDPEVLFASRYPPGSVAKIMTGLLALQENLELPNEFVCKGLEIVEGDTQRCSVRTGHGEVDFSRALSQSCNLYFQNLANELDAKELIELWRRLRLDEKVGVDLPGEVESVIPGTTLKTKALSRPTSGAFELSEPEGVGKDTTYSARRGEIGDGQADKHLHRPGCGKDRLGNRSGQLGHPRLVRGVCSLRGTPDRSGGVS
jgi:hypothetical protein